MDLKHLLVAFARGSILRKGGYATRSLRVHTPNSSLLARRGLFGQPLAMGLEIERKFLVSGVAWRHQNQAIQYLQGYISQGTGPTVRIRIAGETAFLTIKGPVIGISREEFEYSIPIDDARELLKLCNSPIIEKKRSKIFEKGHLWEIDEFGGDNSGLVVAEVELDDAGEEVLLPSWVGKEVTGDARYYNSNLAIHPYSTWRNH
jgi:CYTH domain-containing protein